MATRAIKIDLPVSKIRRYLEPGLVDSHAAAK